MVAKKLCSVFIDPICLSSFLACHLVALDKNPGIIPIGICETLRSIIAKSVLSITRPDILDDSGSLQLCVKEIAGVETDIHTVRSSSNEESAKWVLLVDATNAFNSLNRSSALLNICHLCPALVTILINCYREPVDLFVGGTVLKSQEGTTQGDPLAMPIYALATVPLIRELSSTSDAKQVWYANDSAAFGKISSIR